MPVCVHCAYPTQHLYTTYSSQSNIRLDVCPRCGQFLDPLIEHPPTILLLDLILLKPRVYLHLLFNRHAAPQRAGLAPADVPDAPPGHPGLRWDLLRLAILFIAAETSVRQMTSENAKPVARDAILVLLEFIAQHAATLVAASCCLFYRGWLQWPTPSTTLKPVASSRATTTRASNPEFKDGRRDNFSLFLVNLTLLIASLLPLLLHLIISIWSTSEDTTTLADQKGFIRSMLPSILVQYVPLDIRIQLDQLADTGADKIWIMTRLLGGMSAGFGLRVLLPTTPLETTLIVLSGWAAAAGVGKVVAPHLDGLQYLYR